MGMCTSQQPKKSKPLIKLIKIKMDVCHQSKNIEDVIQIWNKIDEAIAQQTSTKFVNDLKEDVNKINKLLKSNHNPKYLETFFVNYDQFQLKFNDQINQHQELYNKYENIFNYMDSLNSKFSILGLCTSRLGCTQSQTKYN